MSLFSFILVECFFCVITRRAIRRGSFTSVTELTDTIGAFIDQRNDHPRPFAWTKDADEILASINRADTKDKPGFHKPLGRIAWCQGQWLRARPG